MATLDAVFPELASRLVDKFGATALLQTVTRTADPVTGKATETVGGATVKITPPEPFTVGVIDGTLVEAGDLTTVIAVQGLAVPPAANRDRLAFASATWQIVAVAPIYSGDAVAAYRLQLRR